MKIRNLDSVTTDEFDWVVRGEGEVFPLLASQSYLHTGTEWRQRYESAEDCPVEGFEQGHEAGPGWGPVTSHIRLPDVEEFVPGVYECLEDGRMVARIAIAAIAEQGGPRNLSTLLDMAEQAGYAGLVFQHHDYGQVKIKVAR